MRDTGVVHRQVTVGARGVARVAATALVAMMIGCSSPHVGTHGDALAGATVTFMHGGFAAGPVLFTDDTGHLIEERRYESFGTPIDAHFHGGSGDSVGNPDVIARDHNVLNKRTEVATGWSDHGARWFAPELARWATPDPPIAAPGATFMFAPWQLHPYQYAAENPVAFWDPDGKCAAPILGPGQIGICVEAYIATSFADHLGACTRTTSTRQGTSSRRRSTNPRSATSATSRATSTAGATTHPTMRATVR